MADEKYVLNCPHCGRVEGFVSAEADDDEAPASDDMLIEEDVVRTRSGTSVRVRCPRCGRPATTSSDRPPRRCRSCGGARLEPGEAPDLFSRLPGLVGISPEELRRRLAEVPRTIEARIRSIGEPLSPKRIEAEVVEIVEKRWRNHQLDDSELMLSDLRKIREAFLRVLIGMYHQRVKYPDLVEGEEGGHWSDVEEPSERSPETGDGD